MKKKELQKLLKKNKSNAGFTLTELLVGLFMSIFVIGALGFGLMQVLQATQTEGSKTAARNETGRALDFISDELRRAQAIEVNNSVAYLTTDDDPATTIDESVAPDYDLPTGGTVSLALQIPDVDQRVIYSVAPPQSGSPWKGPLVIYRWGPELTANGSYSTTGTKSVSNPAGWTNEALIDKIDDAEQTETCGGTSTIFYGFFACVVDDDGDQDAAGNPIVENATDTNGDGEINSDDPGVTDKNGDGKINNEDGADIDGKAITAQLYFTGETITVTGASGYSADTQTVARARIAPENNSEDLDYYSWSIEGLGGEYNCQDGVPWDMRTEFDNEPDNPNNQTIDWTQTLDQNKQAQAIEINRNKPLKIISHPEGTAVCISSRDPVEHTIDFGNPITFNGDQEDNPDYNDPIVNPVTRDDQKVQFFKKNYNIPQIGGYIGDPDDPADDQLSLGKFLYTKGLAIPVNGGDPNDPATRFRIPKDKVEMEAYLNASSLSAADKKKFRILENDQRIIAFEIGQDNTTLQNGDPNPGFDLQDNIFIVTSDVFEKKFDSACFGGGGCPNPNP